MPVVDIIIRLKSLKKLSIKYLVTFLFFYCYYWKQSCKEFFLAPFEFFFLPQNVALEFMHIHTPVYVISLNWFRSLQPSRLLASHITHSTSAHFVLSSLAAETGMLGTHTHTIAEQMAAYAPREMVVRFRLVI